MEPSSYLIIGAIIVGAAEHIIAELPIKSNSTVQLVLAVLKAIVRKK